MDSIVSDIVLQRDTHPDDFFARLQQYGHVIWEYKYASTVNMTLFMALALNLRLCTRPVLNLVMQQIPPRVIQLQSSTRSTVLHFAANVNNVNMVSAILEKSDIIEDEHFICAVSVDGRTAMEEAAHKGCREVVEIFLYHGIRTDRVVHYILHHHHHLSPELLQLLQLVLDSPLPIFEDLGQCGRDVIECVYDDNDSVHKVLRYLNIAAQRQTKYKREVKCFFFELTNLVPVLISIVGHYARLAI